MEDILKELRVQSSGLSGAPNSQLSTLNSQRLRRPRERDGEDEEGGHLDFGVAEVVFEEAGDEEGRAREQGAGEEGAEVRARLAPREAHGPREEEGHENEVGRGGEEAVRRGDLQGVVVEARHFPL